MSRDLRIEYEGAFHHVINRGYHKMNIFIDKQDFNRFLDDLEATFNSHTLVIHSFCLMNNHFHLFTETPLANLQEALHKLQTRYACYFKKKYGHSGKVFERRYKAILVDSDQYALNLTRYIHRNPLAAFGYDPVKWQASSYRIYLGLATKPNFLDTDLVLNKFDTNRSLAIAKLKEHTCLEEANSWSASDFIIGQSILGTKDFIERIKDKLPEKINTELSGLIRLNSDAKVATLKSFVSKFPLDINTMTNLLVYGLRKKTYLNSKEINSIIGATIKASSLSCRIATLKKQAKTDLALAKALIAIDSNF